LRGGYRRYSARALPLHIAASYRRSHWSVRSALLGIPASALIGGELDIRTARRRVIEWGQSNFRILPRSTCFSNNRSDFRASDETRLPVTLSRVLPLVECTFLITPTGFLKVIETRRGDSRIPTVIFSPTCFPDIGPMFRAFDALASLVATSCLIYFPNTCNWFS